MRAREFLMKDAYSFHHDEASLAKAIAHVRRIHAHFHENRPEISRRSADGGSLGAVLLRNSTFCGLGERCHRSPMPTTQRPPSGSATVAHAGARARLMRLRQVRHRAAHIADDCTVGSRWPRVGVRTWQASTGSDGALVALVSPHPELTR